MKILQKTIFAFLVAAAVLIPQQAIAQTTAQSEQCKKLREQFNRAGGGEIIGTLPEYCTVGLIYTKILDFALYAVGIAAVIAVIYGGFLYMTSGANEAQRKKGRTVLTWAIIGLVVVVLATVIVNVVFKAVVENQFV